MNEITTLFTAIGDFFTKSDWSAMIKWPFWILLFTIAAGGVYCARFGKKTLLNQGIIGTLNVIAIYLGSITISTFYVPLRKYIAKLPFLVLTGESVSLVDPLALELEAVAPLLLKLMILVFLVVGAESFRTGGKTIITWFLSECCVIAGALCLYAIVIVGISFLLPALMNRYAILPVILFISVGILMICLKFIFTTVVTGGNPYFSSMYKFFTVNRAGSMFTVSALSYLLTVLVLGVLQAVKITTVIFASVNQSGLWIILVLLLGALYIFGMYFVDKKKG